MNDLIDLLGNIQKSVVEEKGNRNREISERKIADLKDGDITKFTVKGFGEFKIAIVVNKYDANEFERYVFVDNNKENFVDTISIDSNEFGIIPVGDVKPIEDSVEFIKFV